MLPATIPSFTAVRGNAENRCAAAATRPFLNWDLRLHSCVSRSSCVGSFLRLQPEWRLSGSST